MTNKWAFWTIIVVVCILSVTSIMQSNAIQKNYEETEEIWLFNAFIVEKMNIDLEALEE